MGGSKWNPVARGISTGGRKEHHHETQRKVDEPNKQKDAQRITQLGYLIDVSLKRREGNLEIAKEAERIKGLVQVGT